MSFPEKSPLNGSRILLAVTGGIAAYKAVTLLRNLKKSGADVQIVGTKNSLQFVGAATWESLSGRQPLFDTWETPDSSKISHIMLAQEVDAIIVAPATANIIAKAANGIADDLVSTILCAANKPVLFAPCMNTEMYNNPATRKNIDFLTVNGKYFILPDTGLLACGDSGKGRMPDPEMIVRHLTNLLTPKTGAGLSWCVAAGNTREYIDPIRFITNGATGATGLAIAQAAADRGGKVSLVAGNMRQVADPFLSIHPVCSAREMYDAVMKIVPSCDILIMSAAVADYSPVKTTEKLKKTDSDLLLQLHRTKDILAETASSMRSDAVRIGFAAETANHLENSQKKLERKQLDFIIANKVSSSFSPFGATQNQVSILFPGKTIDLPLMEKTDLAQIIASYAISIAIEKKNGSKNEK